VIAALGHQRRVEAEQPRQLARGAAGGDHHGFRRQRRVGDLHRGHPIAVAHEAAHPAALNRAAVGREALRQGRHHRYGLMVCMPCG